MKSEAPEEPFETDRLEDPVETENPETPTDAECPTIGEDETFDYIVVGAGACGIPVAEHLTRAGHKVLLIEKASPATARWYGEMKPKWLKNKALTWCEVPGLCNRIWNDSTGIVCVDMDQIAGCVLGDETAVNAGLWWKVSQEDHVMSSNGSAENLTSHTILTGTITSQRAGRART